MFTIELSTINLFFALGGLGLLVVTIGLFIDYYRCQSKLYKKYVEAFVWPVLMVVIFGGVASTLLYSEVFGFIPCSLCWLQRIALYPQALFVVMSFQTKERIFYPLYGMGLSVAGFIVAVYHYIYQAIPKDAMSGFVLPCLVDGTSDCATKIMNEFGFVTFPFLSAVTFAFLIVIFMNMRKVAKG